LATAARSRYLTFLRMRWFQAAISVLFIVQAVATVLTVGSLAAVIAGGVAGSTDARAALRETGGVTQWIGIGASLIAGVVTLVGVVELWRDRLQALRLLEIAILLDLLLAQPLALLQSQLAALGGVVFDLALLGTLRYMVIEERRLAHRRLAHGTVVHTS